jgi:hypothetical protein
MTIVTTRVMTTVLLLALSATGRKAQEPVRIAASPPFAVAALPARSRACRAECGQPHAHDHRERRGYYPSSLIELESETSARKFFVEFKQAPRLMRQDNVRSIRFALRCRYANYVTRVQST